MTKTIEFTVEIAAPPRAVWETMFGDAGYREWAAVFAAGCYYEGGWEEGDKIRFLAPSGGGMTAEIAESRRYEILSIRHLGEVRDGVEDTTSDAVLAWAPAYETYRFVAAPAGTLLRVSVDVAPDWESYMLDTFPKALAKLREICER